MLHIVPSLFSRHPHGGWPDGSPVQDVADLLDVKHRVGVLVGGGNLCRQEIIFTLIFNPEISGFSGSVLHVECLLIRNLLVTLVSKYLDTRINDNENYSYSIDPGGSYIKMFEF